MYVLFKLAASLIIVILSHYLFSSVYFPFLFQMILVGGVLAAVALLSERALLKRGTLWASTIFDLFAAAAVMFLAPYLLPGASVTLGGAFLTALVFGLLELVQHVWLINNGRTRKHA